MIDDQSIRALAYIAARCRPPHSPHADWTEAGIVANIRKISHLGLAEVTLAVIRAASNPHAATPGVIPILDGEHWRDQPLEIRGNRPPRADEACPLHGGWNHNCPGCKADQLAAGVAPSTPPNIQRPLNPEQVADKAAAARAALTAGRTSTTSALGD